MIEYTFYCLIKQAPIRGFARQEVSPHIFIHLPTYDLFSEPSRQVCGSYSKLTADFERNLDGSQRIHSEILNIVERHGPLRESVIQQDGLEM